MDRVKICAYALGGACFAVLISGCVEPTFWTKAPLIGGLLGAGFPLTIAPTFALDAPYTGGWWMRRRIMPWLGMWLGIITALAGLSLFFVALHPAVGSGFIVGVCFLVVALYDSFGRPFLEEVELKELPRASEEGQGRAG